MPWSHVLCMWARSNSPCTTLILYCLSPDVPLLYYVIICYLVYVLYVRLKENKHILFYSKNDVNVHSKSNKQKNYVVDPQHWTKKTTPPSKICDRLPPNIQTYEVKSANAYPQRPKPTFLASKSIREKSEINASRAQNKGR
jgi:hypothetical protein